MAKIEKFEDLKCWQEARKLVKHIFLISARGELAKEFTLTNQLKRASLSAMTNIAEGFSRYHKKDFIRFLDYAQSSLQEVRSQLYVVYDLELMPEDKIAELQKQCDKTKKLTLGLLKHVRESLTEYGRDAVREEKPEYEVPSNKCRQLPKDVINKLTPTPKHPNTQTPQHLNTPTP